MPVMYSFDSITNIVHRKVEIMIHHHSLLSKVIYLKIGPDIATIPQQLTLTIADICTYVRM